MTNYWEAVERQWQNRFLGQLKPLLDVTRDAHAFMADMARHPDIEGAQHSEQLGAERLLLRRLGEELRGVELLATNGHGYQAAGAAANLFEQAHHLAAVSDDEEQAKRFANWSDPLKSPFGKVKDAFKNSGKARGWEKDRTEEEYKTYGMLCGFKHNNPVFFRLLQSTRDPDLYLARLSLSNAISFTLTSVMLMAMKRLSNTSLLEFVQRCNSILDGAEALMPGHPEDRV
jgi:hypothetical protein